jgi:hypothetical protein
MKLCRLYSKRHKHSTYSLHRLIGKQCHFSFFKNRVFIKKKEREKGRQSVGVLYFTAFSSSRDTTCLDFFPTMFLP